jgi:SAM-dependent methyltransferase
MALLFRAESCESEMTSGADQQARVGVCNLDPAVVRGFGEEWVKFPQNLKGADLESVFECYFAGFPWEELPPDAEGFDLGCGTGRFAYYVAPRVGRLHCIDPSFEALEVARRNLAGNDNCEFHCASVDSMPLPENSADFGYSLGVLHHVPDTARGIAECVRRLKPGAPLLLYLYYSFENRPPWYRRVWRASDLIRRAISRLPFAIRSPFCDALAALVYWPCARAAALCERAGADVRQFPLTSYRNRSFYFMRTDCLDRFGTRLEQRFTRAQIAAMMERAGLEQIRFLDYPCWCAIGRRKAEAHPL